MPATIECKRGRATCVGGVWDSADEYWAEWLNAKYNPDMCMVDDDLELAKLAVSEYKGKVVSWSDMTGVQWKP